jgi:hypothetical protein
MATPAGDRGQRSGIAPLGRKALFPVHGDHTSETKPFYLTSEFLVYAIFMIGLGIAAATDATIDSRFFWTFATILTVAYMLSRGIAKAATRSRAHDPREDIGRD